MKANQTRQNGRNYKKALCGYAAMGAVMILGASGGALLAVQAAETETETESETKKTTSVKTGDDTPIAPYMALMLASMAMLAAEFICRRKRRSEK